MDNETVVSRSIESTTGSLRRSLDDDLFHSTSSLFYVIYHTRMTDGSRQSGRSGHCTFLYPGHPGPGSFPADVTRLRRISAFRAASQTTMQQKKRFSSQDYGEVEYGSRSLRTGSRQAFHLRPLFTPAYANIGRLFLKLKVSASNTLPSAILWPGNRRSFASFLDTRSTEQ